MGATDVQQVRADAALVWALAGTGATITLLDPGQLPLREGIGAVLRWADPSTPHDAGPSMPGHGEPPGA